MRRLRSPLLILKLKIKRNNSQPLARNTAYDQIAWKNEAGTSSEAACHPFWRRVVKKMTSSGRFAYQISRYCEKAMYVQKQVNARRVRLPFGSAEYFAVLARHPQVKSWLALGPQVEFTIGDTIYEVTE